MVTFRRSALLAPVALLAGSMATLGLSSAAHADPVGVACGDTVTASVTLTGDLDCTGETGTAVITVGADDVTVDLGGYTISNTEGFERVIDVSDRRDVRVRNGTLYGPDVEPVTDCSAEVAGTCAAYLYEPTGIRVADSTDVRLERLFVLYTGWVQVGGRAVSAPADPAAAEAADQGEVGALAGDVGVGVGVDVVNSSKVRMDNVESVGSQKDGGNIEDSTDVTIKRSSFSDNEDDGLYVDTNSSKVTIYQSRFDGNADDDGLDLQACRNVSVKKTSMSHNGDNGLEVSDCSNVRVHDSIAHANDDDGIRITDVSGFNGNKLSISYNNSDGFDAYESEFRLHDSTLVDNDDDGLETDYGNSWRIHKVLATLNGDDGFDIEDLVGDPSAYRLEDNVANTNGDTGFEIDGTVTAKKNSAGGNGDSNAVPSTLVAPMGPGSTPACGATITSDVVFDSDLDCTGQTGTAVLDVDADNVTINLNGYTISNTEGFERVIDITDRQDVRVRNGTLYGPDVEPVTDCSADVAVTCAAYEYEPLGILVDDSTDITLENLFVLDTGWIPAAPTSKPAPAEARHGGDVGPLVVIPAGIGINIQNSSKVRIANVESVGTAADGGNIVDSSSVTIRKSSFSDSGWDGLWLARVSNVTIHESRFDGNYGVDGLGIDSCQNVSVKKSSMSRNGDNGLEASDCSNLRVHDSIAHANDDDGMGITNVSGLHGHKLSSSYNGDLGFGVSDSEYRLHDSTLVDNDTDGLESDGGDSWRIHKVRSTLNGDDGFDIDVTADVDSLDAEPGASPYRLEDNVANTNCNEGFVIDGTVTEKNNSAGGNGGERCGGGGTPTCTASFTPASVNLPYGTSTEDTTPASQLGITFSGFTAAWVYLGVDSGGFTSYQPAAGTSVTQPLTLGNLAVTAGQASWAPGTTHTLDVGLAEGDKATSMVCQASLSIFVEPAAG